jgi:hypothetical protein
MIVNKEELLNELLICYENAGIYQPMISMAIKVIEEGNKVITAKDSNKAFQDARIEIPGNISPHSEEYFAYFNKQLWDKAVAFGATGKLLSECNHRLIPLVIDPMTNGYTCIDCGKEFEAYVHPTHKSVWASKAEAKLEEDLNKPLFGSLEIPPILSLFPIGTKHNSSKDLIQPLATGEQLSVGERIFESIANLRPAMSISEIANSASNKAIHRTQDSFDQYAR